MYPKTPQNIYNGLGALQPLKSPSSRNIFHKDQSIALQRTSKLLNYFEILPKERLQEREKERGRVSLLDSRKGCSVVDGIWRKRARKNR